ncbi:hypothetical protein [Synechococcus phage S-H34]|uniref:HNH nuclease domain-containing protein n=1 Tax=Synechococcus phage S-H34 TaxID=2718942 RepID=A0A6G8R6D3_9CAUD|nr:hypothetical protein PQC15_gp075 [Synechococcus phage S-H34]QIN96946.1 hypothetical protein [Synechococcus phage S-H34]
MELYDNEQTAVCEGLSNYIWTSFGRVWSKPRPRSKGGWLSPTVGNISYHYNISLVDDKGKHISCALHRMVGRLFLPGWTADQLVLHKDETLSEEYVSRVSNLWLGSHKDNHQDRESKCRGRYANYGWRLWPEELRLQIVNDSKSGISQRKLSLTYDLPRSQIRALISQYK